MKNITYLRRNINKKTLLDRLNANVNAILRRQEHSFGPEIPRQEHEIENTRTSIYIIIQEQKLVTSLALHKLEFLCLTFHTEQITQT